MAQMMLPSAPSRWIQYAFVVSLFMDHSPLAFHSIAGKKHRPTPHNHIHLDAAKEGKDGYKFGDLTRGLLKKGTEKINEITGKEGDYEFGDLSRHLDTKAKQRILKSRQNINTTNDEREYSYQFGDLSRWASHLVEEKAAEFTGTDDYKFGDVTKTVLHRVRSGEYRVDDVYLALRILATAGISILPITNALPLKMLLQLAEADLVKDVGIRITESVATSLDARFKQALTGKSDYQLGDWTRDRLKQQITKFTGKENYEFGDIFRALNKPSDVETLSSALQAPSEQAIADWDERFLSANGNITNFDKKDE